MAIHANLMPALLGTLSRLSRRESLIALGRQKVTFGAEALQQICVQEGYELLVAPKSGPLTQEGLFRSLGFSTVHSIDISNYEDATFQLDLNEPSTPDHLSESYDIVFNGGTIEHVFHVGNALFHATSMARKGGVVVHLNPSNDWIDHGFYQLSPTLMFDFYNVNESDILESIMISKSTKDNALDDIWHFNSYIPGDDGDPELRGKKLLHYFVAGKPTVELPLRVPLQGTYQKKHNRSLLQKGVETGYPYDVANGRRVKVHAEIDLLENWTKPTKEGHKKIVLKRLAKAAGLEHVPNGFTCLVKEDGVSLPAVSDLRTSGASGGSKFMRRANAVCFSTRKEADPRGTGCRYSLVYRVKGKA
jgi:hypothetical protein